MKEQWNESTATAKGLYDPSFEHDNCGIGAVVNIKGIKTHQTVENALKIVENLRPEMVLVFFFRFPISSLRKRQSRLELSWEKREITASECFSSHRMS